MVNQSCVLALVSPLALYPHVDLPDYLESIYGPNFYLLVHAQPQVTLTESALPTVVGALSLILGGVVLASPLFSLASKLLFSYLPSLTPASWL